MDELEKQHLEELKAVRASLYEAQVREKELVMILNTLAAARKVQVIQAAPEA